MNIRSGYADVAGGQVHYRTSGTEGPVVILLHQTPLSSRMFERALSHLAAHCRAYAIDTPGYGGSSPLPGPASVEGYAGAVLAVVSSLGAKRFAIAGFATGAAIAIEVARQAGQRTSHLLLSGTPLMSPERFGEFAAALGEPEVRRDGQHLLKIWDGRLRSYGGDNDLDQVQMAASEAIRVCGRLNRALLAVARYDLSAALGQLRAQALFLTAERDRLAAANRAAAALVKGATEVVLKDGLPQLCWTEPEWFSRQVRDFLATG